MLVLRILAVVALYGFLGMVLYHLWHELQLTARSLEKRHSPELDLLIDTPDEPQRSLHFNLERITIGRDPDCDCILTHSTVSANHTQLKFHHAQWWIEDLNSTNGTLLNSEQVKIPTVVMDGDLIKCGQVLLLVHYRSENDVSEGEQNE